jgi:hypothetical protein
MSMNLKEIEIFTTADLLNELRNRFDHCVFAGRRRSIKNDGSTMTVSRWKGDHTICEGLTTELAFDLNIERGRNSTPADISRE